MNEYMCLDLTVLRSISMLYNLHKMIHWVVYHQVMCDTTSLSHTQGWRLSRDEGIQTLSTIKPYRYQVYYWVLGSRDVPILNVI